MTLQEGVGLGAGIVTIAGVLGAALAHYLNNSIKTALLGFQIALQEDLKEYLTIEAGREILNRCDKAHDDIWEQINKLKDKGVHK